MMVLPINYNLAAPQFLKSAYTAPLIGGGRPPAWPPLSLLFVGTFKLSGVFIPIVKH